MGILNNFCAYQSWVCKVSHEDDDDVEEEKEEHLNGKSHCWES